MDKKNNITEITNNYALLLLTSRLLSYELQLKEANLLMNSTPNEYTYNQIQDLKSIISDLKHAITVLEKEYNKKTKTNLPEGWNSVDITPPNKLIQLIDTIGNIVRAYPYYITFKLNIVGKTNNPKDEWDGIVPCEPYWDGTWMVNMSDLMPEFTNPIGWKEIDDK